MIDGTLANLVTNPQQLERVASKLIDAVASSFATHGGRQTQQEIKRRTNIAIKAFQVCRGDMGFSVTRAADEMLPAILANLLDTQWEPQKGRAWSAQNTVQMPHDRKLGMHNIPKS